MKNIVVERGATKSLTELPAYSIALDGYVQGPQLDIAGHRFSFDHHDNCIRLVTSATCQQVRDALLLGLNPTEYTAYINDVDGDTVLSVWLLQNPDLVREPLIDRLVRIVGAMDAHGPAYPRATHGVPSDAVICSVFYERVMAPEKEARKNRTYATYDLATLLNECLLNMGDFEKLLDAYEYGVPEETQEYALKHSGRGWIAVESKHFIFDRLYQAGHVAALAYYQQEDGSYAYTIARKSDLVDFPVGPHSVPGTILHALNGIEPGWGGGSTIGGAPRNPDGSRSHLDPEKVIKVISALIQGKPL